MLSFVTKYNYIRFLLLSVYESLLHQLPKLSGTYLLKQVLIDNFSDSDNLFKKILIINKIKGLEKVAGYLMFVLKKLDAGLIRYDTIVSNLLSDKSFLTKEIINFLKLDKKLSEEQIDLPKENRSLKIPEKLFTLKDSEADEIDKEFTKENYDKDVKLELVRSETLTNKDVVFTLPDEDVVERELDEVAEKVETEPLEKTNETNTETKEEKSYNYTQQNTILKEEEKEIESLFLEGSLSERTIESDPLDRTEEINSLYIEFEKEVTNKNTKLRDRFNHLLIEDIEQGNDAIIEEVIELAGETETYSAQMTFEVIPSLYSIIKDYFICYKRGLLKQLSSNDLKMFLSYLDLVETLIKGEDLSGFEDIIVSIENFKKQIVHLKSSELEATETSPDAKVDAFELGGIEFTHNERESYRKIRENILYIKNVFDSIEQIESKYKIYEALTSLSKILPQLREIVAEARQINQIDIARLAEATYIFIKFIQNYRINPFEREVTEVLKYIIYNFKLLYLNKPADDLNLFIKYLNNPTKIFENNDTK